MENEAIISVGSNIEPEKNVALARENIAKIARLIGSSCVMKTKPMEFFDQPDFLNGAFRIITTDDFDTLNRKLKEIEIKQGRIKTEIKAGPRTVDLDIIVWNNKIISESFYTWHFLTKLVLELKPELKEK